ncbi:sugar phosphate isomerase/epimerase family protein [Aspergillus stella-maris]|uniref:sugar phosphate isomerase/epimerase family protein n=1 Tax=Aspergillus stella-maris TaxID=1810926 RepID=UPI003CCCC2D0
MPDTKIPYSFATCSLGAPTDPLPQKLTLISSAGFTGIELAFPDLQSHASSLSNKSISDHDFPSLISAAKDVKKLVKENGLEIVMLQPFSNFEGWPRGSEEYKDAFERARGWIEIMSAVGTDMLQVGSSDTPLTKLSPSSELRGNIVSDLRDLADLLKEKGMRLAYENWCWSSHAAGWKDVWDIVQEVDRDNIGLCLDTFQSAGGEWGDPTTTTGIIGNVEIGSSGEKDLTKRWKESLSELTHTVPKEKIYILQISDAYIPLSPSSSKSAPLSAEVVEGTAPRGRWSHDYRPVPYDGGYLPIEDFGKAVLETGFRGWFSMEVFDQGVDGRGKGVGLEMFVERAGGSMDKFVGKCLA